MAAPELGAYDAVVAREAPARRTPGAAIDALITPVYDRGNLQETFL
ncbi:hypothetical protein GCM10027161_70240 [Microbispora hainanensis]